MVYSIGTDTGGTFTDTVVVDEAGAVTVGKRPSTPPEFVEGVLDSVGDAAGKLGVSDLLSQTSTFLYGTTIVVNAVTTGHVGRIGLLTTQGFGSTLDIARAGSRTNGFTSDEMHWFAQRRKPTALVPPSRRFVREIPERVDWSGTIVAPLDEEAVKHAVQSLLDLEVDSIAVCLLWSFRNDTHEQRIKELCADVAPHLPVTLSSELVPKLGEYERMATVAYNAALAPIAAEHLKRLNSRLTAGGLGTNGALVMQGNGGLDTSERAAQRPVNLIGSGPAGGVLGSKLIGDALGLDNIICTDVGGTTFDLGLIVSGQPSLTPAAVVRQHRLYLPIVDVVSIGAGGGSIAQVDTSSGHLTVGPQSAGARPGPVCYGAGGTRPTVTDADLVLGLIDPEFFLGGTMKLDRQASYDAIRTQIAEPLGLDVDSAAAAIVEIADNHMADCIRQHTVERGHDPRDFTTFLYGGGGPLHGTSYAAKLQTKGMIVPGGALASVFSAWGIAGADIHHTHQMSRPQLAPFEAAQISEAFELLEKQAEDRFGVDGIEPDKRVMKRVGELRYASQTHEVDIPVPDGAVTEESLARVVAAFEERYEHLYGKGSGVREAGIEWVNFRVQAYGVRAKPQLPKLPPGDPRPTPFGHRDVYWFEAGKRLSTAVYRAEDLSAGSRLQGPAVVELPTTTVALHPGQDLAVDEYGNYLITSA
ncbi:hydantoinase/oxoprolinase family protein [Rhodococcus sp. NPDC127530]|uniref:hydantoinase/oxoprolinase family protein n=1 Tax=unclassified Rhodococcus (in: high G+C Gram-positive bacteria) TaxID=192944 RepID=UPI00364029F6